jgi:hypothetical protein
MKDLCVRRRPNGRAPILQVSQHSSLGAYAQVHFRCRAVRRIPRANHSALAIVRDAHAQSQQKVRDMENL